MQLQQAVLSGPKTDTPSKLPYRRCKLVLLTEIISPYRIPVFNALAAQEMIDLHVIFLAETDPTQRQWLVYRDEIRFSYEILPSWRRRLGSHNLLVNRKMTSALESSAPDVIVCGGYNYLASWQSLWWARSHRVPFVIWVESTAADRRNRHLLIESLKRKFMRNCDAFIAAGKSSGEYVESFGVEPARIFIAPDAVDTQFFAKRAAIARQNGETLRRELGLPRRFFLFVGRMIREKGVVDLLTAYATLAVDLRKEIGLVFVGEGPMRRELEDLARSISPGAVRFAGFVQREQLPIYYGLAETFVFPTHTDPWGLVVNEAMSCGLPVICSDAAGCAADLVEDGWNGRVLPAGDPAALVSAMKQLATEAELRLQMGKHSWERIQLHSPEACAAGIAAAAQSCGVCRHA